MDLIDEYIYYKDINKYKNKIEPPMDYLWYKLELGSCDECCLVIVLALFIIGACYSIPQGKSVSYNTPGLYAIKTAEDLYYLTLLSLYEKYADVNVEKLKDE